MKKFTTKKQKIGLIGEKTAEMFLVKLGFSVIETNFSCRFGEIDLITTRENRLHFIEVKTITVSHETESITKSNNVRTVSRETFLSEYRKLSNPFQNVSFFKIKRLLKTAEIYLSLRNVPRETLWQVDGVGVYLNNDMSVQKIEYLENITIR